MKLRWRLAWLLTYPLAKAIINLRVEGRRNLRECKRGVIVAANHSSNFDPLILGWAAAREIYFLAKEELFCYRPFAWLIKAWNALPVGRGGIDIRAIRLCSEVLKHNKTLVLFPEGTRSKTGEMAGFKSGVGMLALLNQVPVVPTYISGMNGSIVSYFVDRDFVRLGLRKKPSGCVRIRVKFGAPIQPEGFKKDRQGYQEMTAVIEERVRTLVG